MRFAILDSQIGPGLCNYIMEKRKDITPIICDSTEDVLTCNPDVVIASIDYYGELKRKAVDNTHIIGLKEENDGNDPNMISPYHSADELLTFVFRELNNAGKLLPQKRIMTDTTGKVISFLSIYARDYLDGISYVYAMVMAQMKKALFISFLPYDSFFISESPDIGDLFYELHKPASSMDIVLRTQSVLKGDLTVVYPFLRQQDAEDLTVDDYKMFIKRLFEETDYEALIVSLPPNSKITHAFYNASDVTYVLDKETPLAARAFEKLQEDLKYEEAGKLEGICIPANLKSVESAEEVSEELLFGETAKFVKTRLLTDE